MPRTPDTRLSERILDAGADLLLEVGYDALTFDAVAARAGTTRAAVYRRHPDRMQLVLAVLAPRFGLEPVPDTGALKGDVLAHQRHLVTLWNDPLTVRCLPAMLRLLLDGGDDAATFRAGFLAPRRASVQAMVSRAVARGELAKAPTPARYEHVYDLSTGPLLWHRVAVGPLTDAEAKASARAVVDELRR
jgi:AcrR family transcriptional regulator